MRRKRRRLPHAGRRAAGYGWLAAWTLVLYAVAAPWRRLGGLESELLRWLEWVALSGGVLAGLAIGRFARAAAEASGRPTHANLVRAVLYPPALLTAAALVAWSFAGERGPVGVAFTAFLAYWAGLDVAFGALPLMEGKPWAWERPVPTDDGARPARVGAMWTPPWERP